MATGVDAVLASLQSQHPSIKLYAPESPDYEGLRKTYVVSSARPSAIARPQSAEDVQALVRTCVAKNIDFNIRTGGHSCVGRALVDNALLIDLRDIAYVNVSEDRTTAKVGGGILASQLLKALGEHGLITPCGSTGSVGYVGWSTLGGYGPFSTLYGLGVDQIISATLVNAKGDIVVASDELLKGIRGAGGIFGVIVELTIKIFPLKEMLVGTLIYDSSDMKSIWTTLTGGLSKLSLPAPLKVQLFAMDFPQLGKVLAAIATWVDDDHEEGRKWIDKIASLGNCIVNMTDAKTVAKYGEDNEKLVHYGVYGRSYTLNIKSWTPESVSILAKYSQAVPSGNAMISIHGLASPKPNDESVFGARQDHHMIEIVSMTADPSLEPEASRWGQAMLREFEEQDRGNILESAYISLLDEDANLKKIYNKHYDTLVGLKKKYDADNVFKHSMPKIAL
ncbi:6-hydroxy-D-nicotine oxidase [Cytospora mali]|uniref:6-hydroxy-D-nicotine oxidase n=1 Tax=Cytospora mali TaxID=578113 RepID=A0A194V7D1_CYTMA|nr:6-hydroxy-D-nicotine oxidase [Valsa mali var. pyri (nom. inval.)]